MKKLLAACSARPGHVDAAGGKHFRLRRRDASCCGASNVDEWCPADDDEERDEGDEMIVIDAQSAIPVAVSATSRAEASSVSLRLMQRAEELQARARRLRQMQFEHASENAPKEEDRRFYLLPQRLQNDNPLDESQTFLDRGCREAGEYLQNEHLQKDGEAGKLGWWWSPSRHRETSSVHLMHGRRGSCPPEAAGATAATFSPEIRRSFSLLHDSGVDSPAVAADASVVAVCNHSPCEISIISDSEDGICRSDASPVVGEEGVCDEICSARQDHFEPRHRIEDLADYDCSTFADGEAQKLPSTAHPGPARPGDVIAMSTETQISKTSRPAVNPEDPSTWPFHMKIRVFEEGFLPYAAVATAAVQERSSGDLESNDEDAKKALFQASQLQAFMGA